jgi:DNA-binding NarL/FixJ family response regulator
MDDSHDLILVVGTMKSIIDEGKQMITVQEYLKSRGLTAREIQVAEHVCTGAMNKVVGEKLFVSEKTIKYHMTNIFKKLNIRCRSELCVMCLNFEAAKSQTVNGEPLLVTGHQANETPI